MVNIGLHGHCKELRDGKDMTEIEGKRYKAALVVIGNEILSGRTADKNINWIATKLSSHGVKLDEVRVIPDIKERIISTIHELQGQVDYIFTTGGIGPTHDDITSESIAEACGVAIEQNEDAYAILENHYGPEHLTTARLKMAMIPVGAELIPNPVSSAPGFVIDHIFVMAGVPQIMQAMLDHVLMTLKGGAVVLSRTLTCHLAESVLAEELTEIQKRWPQIEIGSYPSFSRKDFGVSIVLRTEDAEALELASREVEIMMVSKGEQPTIL